MSVLLINAVHKECRSGDTNSILDCLENLAETFENDSAQTAVAAISKRPVLASLYRNSKNGLIFKDELTEINLVWFGWLLFEHVNFGWVI